VSKNFFTEEGVCMIGTMKGLHASKIRNGWVKWAKQEIKGFAEQWEKAVSQGPKPKPEGRTYILKRWN
jgi:hypothetical protein